MNKITVSVLMITYNHENFIREAIEGVLMQKTDFPIEIIIGEDCSTDNTRKIVLEYSEKYPDIIRPLLPENNLGMMKNFIETMQTATGKYIALCEGDDYWTDPYKLQKQVDFLEANEEYSVCYHDAIIVDKFNRLLSISKLPDECKRDFTSDELIFGAWILTLTICFRNKISICDEMLNAENGDTFLTCILGLNGKGKYLGEIIKPAAYRNHVGGVWSSLDEKEKLQKRFKTYIYMYDFLVKEKGLSYAHNFIFINTINIIENIIDEKNNLNLSLKSIYSSRIYRLIKYLKKISSFYNKFFKKHD